MDKITIFDGIEEKEIQKMLTCFQARKLTFKKDRTVISNISNTNLIGIVLKGTANLLRYDYNGNRTIIEKLNENSVFGQAFLSSDSNELSVIATSEFEVLFIDYNSIIKRCKKGCSYHSTLIDNMLQLLSNKIKNINERIEVLTKRTIREKLLEYFSILSKKKVSKSFLLPFSFTDLADYLSIDRSAMMRELKNLKDDGFIESKGKRITLLF